MEYGYIDVRRPRHFLLAMLSMKKELNGFVSLGMHVVLFLQNFMVLCLAALWSARALLLRFENTCTGGTLTFELCIVAYTCTCKKQRCQENSLKQDRCKWFLYHGMPGS